ncbi:MAG: FMN-dependent NADH-azoreductase [Desulfuromonas sp.]|nr:MAG: FMN-dependent NADH-azoreductase [Desulfuromonas sp.]
MKTILVLNSSVMQGDSVSNILVEEAVAGLLEKYPEAEVIRHDLGTNPIPHLDSANVAGVRGVPKTETEIATRALSDKLIAELRSADTLVIGAPMYNFSIPTGLRSWFDYVLRAGETFQYTEQGPQGLLDNKQVILIESRGGLYSEGPAQAMDFQEPYLRTLFGFIGLKNINFVHAEKIGFGPEARQAALAEAKERIATLS